MKPTDEQIRALIVIIDDHYEDRDCNLEDADVRGAALAVFNLIAPMVLEEAAKVCDEEGRRYENAPNPHHDLMAITLADRIRALKEPQP